MNARWRIDLFDGLRAHNGEVEITRFRTQKTAALLAYLAFFPAAHTRDFLIELLWPNVSLETGRNNLRLALASLRRQFEPPGTAQGSVIMTGRIWVQLNPQAYTTDVRQFEELIAVAGEGEAAPAAFELLRQALECYRGPFLRGYSEDWIPVEELRLENLMLGASRRAVRYCQTRGEAEKAQYFIHKAARDSRDAQARTQARRAREPREKVPAPPPAASPADARFAPSLPARLTRFFGRSREIEQLHRCLDDAQSRLVTITGPGGCGKTRLALEVAWLRHEKKPGESAILVPLAEVQDAVFIARAISQALRLPPVAEQSLPELDRVIEALRQSGNLLLVLDNFEQLAAGATVVQRILESVPGLHCLVTSRVVLQLPGEQELRLESLEVPPPGEISSAILQEFASVRLFVDRARARRADFQITPHNAASLGELMRNLGGLPLAIEICAARANVLSPHQMLSQLKTGGELVGDARLGLAGRQNSLRATFEWSYGLLTANLQYALRHLSLFRGGFSLEAAQAVCANVPALSSLAFLRDASLVHSEETIVAPGRSEMRFTMLDTILNFAHEKLGADEKRQGHEHHAMFYLALAESAFSLALSFTPEWQQLIAVEFENFVEALSWSTDARLDLALRFVMALQSYWATYDPALGRALIENVISRVSGNAAVTGLEEGGLMRECGEMAVRQGDLPTGKRWIEASLGLSRHHRDVPGEAAALTALGMIALEQNDDETARSHLQEAGAMYRSTSDAKGLAWTLRHQGVLAQRGGNIERAQACFAESLALFQKLGNRSGAAWISLALGELALEQGRLETALELCEQARQVFRAAGHKTGLLWSLHRSGTAAWRLGEAAQARAYFEESLALARQLQNHVAAEVVERALENIG